MAPPLIILDRDGVINELVFRHGQPDSPMSIQEVKIFPWVVSSLETLQSFGFEFALATNQPAAAKGKISQTDLIAINEHIISQISEIKFSSIQICFHRSEDDCECRKPKTKMLRNALEIKDFNRDNSWMVGDRSTDILAGNLIGLNTALLGPSIGDDIYDLEDRKIQPIYHGTDLRDFTEFIVRQ